MSEYSRTTNTLLNFSSSIGGQALTIIMQFLVRTVFIKTLGKSYLGIDGLFSNILTMLSLTEFGVGSAILFKLYDPIAKQDKHRITVLMKFYKSVYFVIGMTVAVLGASLIPFLPYLIKDYNRLLELHLNVLVIFLLFLAKTVSSYVFFAYKSAIIKANQKEYLINIISYLFTIFGGIVQIIFLLVFPVYEIYVVIAVVQVLAQNVAVAVMADRAYPYINDKTKDRIDRKEIIDLIKDCSALFLYKLNGVVLKATDNIVLSVFVGLEAVGLYSNYYVFYTAINSVMNKIFGSVSHSLGNLHTTHDYEREYKVFETVNLVTAILGGTAFAGIFCVSNEFVNVWVGNEWIIPQPFSVLMGFEVYTLASRISLSRYRNTMGLFQQAKFRPLAGMIINLIVSIALVNKWGICGILVGTLTADWTTFMWFDPLIIHRYGFENYKSVFYYYQRLLYYTMIVFAVCGFDYLLCMHVFTGHGWFSVIVHAIICGISVPLTLILLNLHRQEGKYILSLLQNYTDKISKKVIR